MVEWARAEVEEDGQGVGEEDGQEVGEELAMAS